MSSKTLLPSVLWSQRKETLKLVVQVIDCGPPKIDIKATKVDFSATTLDGIKNYAFTLDLFDNIDTESVIHKVTSHRVDIHLTKAGPGKWWPRLCQLTKKSHFIKLDFDSWMTESDYEDQEKSRAVLEAQQDAEEVEEIKKDLHRRSVLFIYNFIQMLMFLSVFINCAVGAAKEGMKFSNGVYSICGKAVEFGVALAYMEILFVWTGMTKGKVITTSMQVIGRTFAAICLRLAANEIGGQYYILILYLSWSLIDIIRYAQYLMSILTLDIKWLTWLRYTIWIPLYPTGFCCELLVFVNSALYFKDNALYHISMLGFNLGLQHLISLYCVVAPLGFLMLYQHMWKARNRRYGQRKKYKAA